MATIAPGSDLDVVIGIAGQPDTDAPSHIEAGQVLRQACFQSARSFTAEVRRLTDSARLPDERVRAFCAVYGESDRRVRRLLPFVAGAPGSVPLAPDKEFISISSLD